MFPKALCCNYFKMRNLPISGSSFALPPAALTIPMIIRTTKARLTRPRIETIGDRTVPRNTERRIPREEKSDPLIDMKSCVGRVLFRKKRDQEEYSDIGKNADTFILLNIRRMKIIGIVIRVLYLSDHLIDFLREISG